MSLRLSTLLALTLLLLSSSCAKFKSQRRVDFAPFAEQTIASVSDLDVNLSRNRRILTVRYSQDDTELGKKFVPLTVDMQEILTGMVEYSVLIAKISRNELTELEKVGQLVDYFEAQRAALVEETGERGMTPAEFEDALAKIKKAETILHALTAAQPIINSAAKGAARTVRALREVIEEFDKAVGGQVEADYADVFAFRMEQEIERRLLLDALTGVYRYRRGEDGALAEVLSSEVLRDDQRARFDPEAPDVDLALEKYLLERFDNVMVVTDRLRPELDHYEKLHLEIDDMIDSFETEIRATWGTIFVWTRAHERMARGVIDPAEWFDINDAPSAIFGLARGAL